jgi:L-threonylcarbamoyladenylate synthase
MIVPHTEETLGHAAKLISNGGVIAFRTDTFYGLGAHPLSAEAIGRIRDLKGRDENKPILLLIGDASDVDHLIIEKSEDFEVVARSFWPGPLTLIGRAASKLPDELTGGSPARSAEEVAGYFPTGIDLIINGGEVVAATEPSTVLDLSQTEPRVIREGAISQKMLEGVLGVAL